MFTKGSLSIFAYIYDWSVPLFGHEIIFVCPAVHAAFEHESEITGQNRERPCTEPHMPTCGKWGSMRGQSIP